jgi:nitrogen regulatory protein PII
MDCKKVTAIVRKTALDEVERRLKEVGVKGLSTFNAFRCGEYVADWTFHPVPL